MAGIDVKQQGAVVQVLAGNNPAHMSRLAQTGRRMQRDVLDLQFLLQRNERVDGHASITCGRSQIHRMPVEQLHPGLLQQRDGAGDCPIRVALDGGKLVLLR